MKSVTIYTDGSVRSNPGGNGGWACILIYADDNGKEFRKELFGAVVNTTNNRMEMRAALEGLKALKEPCEVTVITDSQYLANGMTSWVYNWKKNGWSNASGSSVLNQDLWQELVFAAARHKVTWKWVRGHNGNVYNERCDQLASRAAMSLPTDKEPIKAYKKIDEQIEKKKKFYTVF